MIHRNCILNIDEWGCFNLRLSQFLRRKSIVRGTNKENTKLRCQNFLFAFLVNGQWVQSLAAENRKFIMWLILSGRQQEKSAPIGQTQVQCCRFWLKTSALKTDFVALSVCCWKMIAKGPALWLFRLNCPLQCLLPIRLQLQAQAVVLIHLPINIAGGSCCHPQGRDVDWVSGVWL